MPDDAEPQEEQRHPAGAGYALAVAALAAAAAATALGGDAVGPDVAAHLEAARHIRLTGMAGWLPPVAPDAPPLPAAWLAELAMKTVWSAGGERAAVLATAAGRAAFVALAAVACRRSVPAPVERFLPPVETLTADDVGRRPSAPAVALATAAAAVVSLPALTFAPVTAALVVFALIGLLVARDRARGERTVSVWAVPLLTVVAVNLHPVALLLPAWLAALAAAAVWERVAVAEPPERPEADRRVCRGVRMTLACVVACCCTPTTPNVVAGAWQIAGGARDVLVRVPGIASPIPGTAIVGGALLVLAIAAWRVGLLRDVRPGERLWVAATAVTAWALPDLRAVAVVAAAPVAAVLLGRLTRSATLGRVGRASAAAACCVMVAAGAWRAASAGPAHVAGLPASAAPAAVAKAKGQAVDGDAVPAAGKGFPTVSGLPAD